MKETTKPRKTMEALARFHIRPYAARLESRMTKNDLGAFTLIELLVVIAIIAVLLGLAFPEFQGVLDRAKKVQAKNDLTQIVTAVNAFYIEYGKYPVADPDQGSDKTFAASNKQLLDILQSIPGNDPSSTDATANKYNPRKIAFLQPPSVKVDTAGNRKLGVSASDGNFYDPWGNVYQIRIDSNYDNILANAYTDGSAGGDPTANYALRAGVIVWSLGKNQTQDSNLKSSDDVISWQ